MKIFPAAYVLLDTMQMLVTLVDVLLTLSIGTADFAPGPKVGGRLFGGVLHLVLWGAYLRRSRRVRRTFVR